MENFGYETRGKKGPKKPQSESFSTAGSQPIIYFEFFQFLEKKNLFLENTENKPETIPFENAPGKKTKRNPH